MASDKEKQLSNLLVMLDGFQPLSTTLKSKIVSCFEIVELNKKSFLLQESQICKDLWFIVDGLARAFHYIGDKETTSRIMFTNHIVIAPGSFFMQTPALESIQLLSNSTLAKISYHQIEEIYKEFPEFNFHTRKITEYYFYKQEQRLYMLRQESAVNKYNYFLENYSSFIKYIPQKQIASFLGIAAETLSRLRAKSNSPKK